MHTHNFLRIALLADAATSGLTGIAMTFAAGLFTQYFGLPEPLTRYAGITLLPYAAFLIYLANRHDLMPKLIWSVIALNLLWTVDSILLVTGNWMEPTPFGAAFVITQALGVAAFAALEYVGLRKSEAVAV